MLFNLAFKNIRKSIKDYSIYFFTLVIAVAIFYLFNSMNSQDSMLVLSSSKRDLIKVLVMLIGYISVFISVVLGFLIIYSNNFLIKRRKKELGLYLTLGMSKRKVSTILVIETLLVGVISLGVGLLVGVFGSQFLSIFTAKLFEANLENFHFVFSVGALLKTLMYFGIIFLFVMIFNVINLSRHKLIDLLTASKKNEKVKFRNKYVVFIAFILSIVLLGYAYSLLFKGTLFQNGPDNESLKMIISGAIGTFLLFFSISGFALKLIQMRKKTYYKGLNMFTLKQVNSKINTSVISTTVICLMLLLTIGILSGSMSLSSVLNKDLKENNLTDFSVNFYDLTTEDENGNVVNYNLDDLISKNEFKDSIKDYVVFEEYNNDDVVISKLINDKSKKQLEKDFNGKFDSVNLDANIPIILESDYVKLKKYLGKDYIDIKDDEYLVMANMDSIIKYIKPAIEDDTTIKINNEKLKLATKEIDKTALMNYVGQGNSGVIIVSDKYKEYLSKYETYMVGNYLNGDKEIYEEKFGESLNGFDCRKMTKLDMEASAVGLKAIMTFLGVYLGIVFAISSATVLAIGQLSESSDNKERYRVLRQLGSDEKMIRKALFTQIAIAFILPLIVAVVHAIFGLRELNSIVDMLAHIDLTGNIIITTLFIVVVYGGYFLATYLVSKNIINEKN